MRAVLQKSFGGVEQLFIGEAPKPVLKAGEILMAVKATAVNRADTLQRQGRYPVPKGESEILGLEAAGVVVDKADDVTTFNVNDRVMALLQGGGYAEFAAVPHTTVMPIPNGWDYVKAACVPEVWLTAFQHLHVIANLGEGDSVLVHAGASGVGTAAIQLARLGGASSVIATVSKEEKLDLCKRMGATGLINYKACEGRFSDQVMQMTDNRGCDIILDCIGASYFDENAKACARDARWVLYGLMGGPKVPEANLATLLAKRVQLTATTLRSRDLAYRSRLVARFRNEILPHLSSEALQVVHDSTLPLEHVQEAHMRMESNLNAGKIVLTL
ncbi:unnamed protein product [Vitrella brassicaformis CCMP3155]|uniref:Enoyl reductase (ER) domain-containing protein n=1 Tax=Vitrella brassicaformis (strain CCMP3155) TaxID=1169540 RepID=A0A0G4H840_VITBC|nr:unnamed protein product [Vitrella brassicaformis CCMP3155]|eukprot:CEM40068.1 unnamed protein product [Vitrella brassicaformis CCMP3155]